MGHLVPVAAELAELARLRRCCPVHLEHPVASVAAVLDLLADRLGHVLTVVQLLPADAGALAHPVAIDVVALVPDAAGPAAPDDADLPLP